MDKKPMSYAEAGVSIDNGNLSVELMKPHVKRTFRKEVVTDLGGFGGLFALQKDKYEAPILVSGTDGVGTKLDLAFKMDKHDTIGIDAVAMCVNDILVSGAEPLFFLDYLAVGQLKPEKVSEIVKGVSEGCVQAGCALIGGETAEMPGFYKTDEYDVAGFSVGIVDKKDIIDGTKVTQGDILIGLSSTGLHSNGFSLARKVFFERGGYHLTDILDGFEKPIGEILLEPTRIYVPYILPLLEKNRNSIKAMAHITGGGLVENLPRILPKTMAARIDKGAWEVPQVFNTMQKIGHIEDYEMYRTFNMGIGFVLVVDKLYKDELLAAFSGEVKAFEIGEIVSGQGQVKFI